MFDSTIKQSVVIGDCRLEPMTNLGSEMYTQDAQRTRQQPVDWEVRRLGILCAFLSHCLDAVCLHQGVFPRSLENVVHVWPYYRVTW